MAISARLREAGFLIPCIRYPTVARGSARLRITVSALHSEPQIRALGSALRETLGSQG
jgi:7-keto-8-aminopelargonate synthetase-like enzyme